MKEQCTRKNNMLFTLLAVMGMGVFIALGVWQIQRGNEKQQLNDLYKIRQQEGSIELLVAQDDMDAFRYRNVRVRGHYDIRHQILLDNQIQNHQVGYHVMTPFIFNNEKKAVLINRGWIPVGADRLVLPDPILKQSDHVIVVKGSVERFMRVGFKLAGADEPSGHWPVLLQFINPLKLQSALGYELLPYQILLNADEPDGFSREWKPQVVSPDKHYGYAFQWFALAFTVLMLWLIKIIKNQPVDIEEDNTRNGS